MKADHYGTDEQFDAYMRSQYVKMALVFLGILAVVLLNLWLP